MSETLRREDTVLSEAERVRARYALGLPNRRRQPSRNHVVCIAHDDWERLVRDGLATVRRPSEPDGLCTYRLTLDGARAALMPGETLFPNDFPQAMPA